MSCAMPLLPPGFRFHPTDEELIFHYLRTRAASSACSVSIIAEIDIYKFDPWDLPSKAMFGDQEWYFFSPRDRKYPNGVRPNRAAVSGYWKATGTDKPIHTSSGKSSIGVKKALVFYKGRPPKGLKTNWIMHEYRLVETGNQSSHKPMKLKDSPMRLDDLVLCKIYKKISNQDALSFHVSTTEEISVKEDTSFNMHKSFSISEFFLDDYSALLDVSLFGMTVQMSGYTGGSSVANQPFTASDESTCPVDQTENHRLFNEQLMLNSHTWESTEEFSVHRHLNTNTKFDCGRAFVG